jgi:hypothetical protein
VYGGTEALGSNIDVDNDALGFSGQSRVAVGHGKSDHLAASIWQLPLVKNDSTHLVGAGDDPGELALLLILTLDNGLNDRRMVAPEVHKDV